MTRKPALEVVADPDDGWQAQAVIDRYSPEHQFVGSLMWLSAVRARPLLDLVPTTAIRRPTTRWAYELIGRLAVAGADPTPVSVLAAARRRPAGDAINPDTPPTAGQYQHLALYLADAYAQAVAPAAAVDTYAREVLDDAYRRAFETCGIRMQQLGASGADREDLTEQFTAIRAELADLWRRAEAANKPEQNQP